MYGGSEIITRWGGRIRVQDSSDASSPHVRVFYEPGEYESAKCLHLNAMEAIELRDRLNQFLAGMDERWGEGALHEALGVVAQHRSNGCEIETGEEEATR